MKLEEFARLILFGTSLDDKLYSGSVSMNLGASPLFPIEIPAFPGRPKSLSRPGKATFPSIHRLNETSERGKVLHFFANHELLAMELMALVLLRFPEAPCSYRQGMVRIIQEEQNHLRLYISRMRQLGIDFGDLPVNDYFWNSMRNTASPLDFTIQMSLTFEQANLDYSLFFKNSVEKAGDEITSAILEKVYREEIGHVKHGLIWFNRWRENSSSESDWDAYSRLLPHPLTPQRAKGLQFCESSRREAGFSENYIQQLRIYSSSKGRPPVIWYYNPHCDSEIARGRVGHTPSAGTKTLSQDLQHLPMFLCLDQDVVLVNEYPRTEWMTSLQKCGFSLPEFAVMHRPDWTSAIRAPKLSGIEPWGWSPDSFEAFQPFANRLVESDGGNSIFCKRILAFEEFECTGLGKFFSKSWSADYLKEWLTVHPSTSDIFGHPSLVGTSYSEMGSALQSVKQILESGNPAGIKAPYGTSGIQVRKILRQEDINDSFRGWLKNILSTQGAVIVEPWLDKLYDLSIQMEIKDECIHLLDARQFITGRRNEYRGTYLGRKMTSLRPEHIRFLQTTLPRWNPFLRDLGNTLRNQGYRGPAGVDALIWKDENGNLKLKPLVELNPRWTMGRVALELEKHLAPGVQGLWLFIPIREIKNQGYENAAAFAEDLQKKYPVRVRSNPSLKRLESGIVFTNDPVRAQSVLTALITLPNPELVRKFTA
jgi:uncharacterized ferritin-like protein (DUF455 family)